VQAVVEAIGRPPLLSQACIFREVMRSTLALFEYQPCLIAVAKSPYVQQLDRCVTRPFPLAVYKVITVAEDGRFV